MYNLKSISLKVLIVLCILALTTGRTEGQSPSYYEQSLNLFDLDISCNPICWNSFVPKQTPMMEVYQWFNLFPGQPPDFQHSPSAANNINATGTGLVLLAAFSDDTHPTPLLRAFYTNVSPVLTNGVPSSTAITSSEIDTLMPTVFFARYGIPSMVTIGGLSDLKYLTFDFPSSHTIISYQMSTSQTPTNESVICPRQAATNISFLVYSEVETDGLTLIRDLENYQDYGIARNKLVVDTEVTNPATIQAIVNSLTQTGCVTSDLEVSALRPFYPAATEETHSTP